ncbi:nuclear migration protein-like protein nudF [Calycina marina]|uniref:Nuclear distribution protein PAC1 n=1 Tax=Calycina marina TaxID=1763456 RepID=A0A9P7ZC72_9HELO|nr:nuclear migration protein-like protein nudF [Calycina marina]
MSQLLTTKQGQELHKALIAYFASINKPSIAVTLREEFSIGDNEMDAVKSKQYEGLLERKWTGVVRLQKKIFELQDEMAKLQKELDSATPSSLLKKGQDPTNWLPRAPAKYSLQSHQMPITSVAFHPVFTSLASASEDSTIKIWDWEGGELEKTLKGHTKAVQDVDYGGPKGATLLASCSNDLTIKLWDPSADYKNIRTLPGHDHSVSAVRFISASGNLLVSASRDKTLRIWDVLTGYCVKTIRGHGDWVRAVSPSLDGQYLLSASMDQTARIWDASSGEPKTTMVGHEHAVECCVFAPPASYQYLATLAGLKKPPPLTSSAEYVATGSRDKTIKLWDVRGQLIKTLLGHDNWVRGLAFHPGGKYLLSVADDKTLRCWDLSQEGKVVKVIDGAHEHFVSSIRWAPSLVTEAVAVNGENGGTPNGAARFEPPVTKIRCAIATGSVDLKVRVFTT